MNKTTFILTISITLLCSTTLLTTTSCTPKTPEEMRQDSIEAFYATPEGEAATAVEKFYEALKTEGLSEAASKFCTGKIAKQLNSMATLLNMAKGGSGYDKSDMGFESVKTATLTNYQDVAMVVIKNKKGIFTAMLILQEDGWRIFSIEPNDMTGFKNMIFQDKLSDSYDVYPTDGEDPDGGASAARQLEEDMNQDFDDSYNNTDSYSE